MGLQSGKVKPGATRVARGGHGMTVVVNKVPGNIPRKLQPYLLYIILYVLLIYILHNTQILIVLALFLLKCIYWGLCVP